MAQYGSAYQTLEIFTGNVRTVQDLLAATSVGGTTAINYTANAAYPNNQLNYFGSVYYDNAPSAKIEGTLTAVPERHSVEVPVREVPVHRHDCHEDLSGTGLLG